MGNTKTDSKREKVRDLQPGDTIRDAHGKVHVIRVVTGSWYRGYAHLHWGKPDSAEDFTQAKRSDAVALVDGAWELGPST